MAEGDYDWDIASIRLFINLELVFAPGSQGAESAPSVLFLYNIFVLKAAVNMSA